MIPSDVDKPGVAPAPINDQWPTLLGPAMTPTAVTNAIISAHRGYMTRITDLLSEQRSKVPHLQGVMATRENAIASRKWIVDARDTGTKGGNTRANKYADYVRARLLAIESFRTAIKHLAGGIYFGRSALEIEWFRDARGIGVRTLHPIHPRRLSYATSWRIHLWDTNGNEYNPRLSVFPGVDIRAEFPDRFIVHQPNTTGAEYPTRQGVGYALVWSLLFAIWDVREWMQFLELNGRPWRIGYFTKDKASEADIAALKQAVKELAGTTSATLPAGADIKLLVPGQVGSAHGDLRVVLNADISKVVLGQTGTTELGDKGSYAAVKVHDLVRGDILADDGASISETINRDLVRPLVRMQFGDEAADHYCPEFSLLTTPDEKLETEFDRFCGLVDRGVTFDANEARARYTGLGVPEANATLVQPLRAQSNAASADSKPNKPASDAAA